jgi:membrane protein implicated in regulation of membrane protease activity
MDFLWIVWVVAGIAFAVAEVFTLGFVLLWFGVGAIAASLVALAGFGVTSQVVVFLIVSILLTIASRTIFENALFRQRGVGLKTGMATLPGQVGTVTEPSHGELQEGAVKVFGSTWTAFPAEGEAPLELGERVAVERVDGATIYVRRVRGTEPSWRS